MTAATTDAHSRHPISYKVVLGVLLILVVCGAGFYLKMGIGIPVKTASPHDSELFFNWTRSLISGQWLGSYNELTLTKGPMMSIVAALAYKAHVPYKLVEYGAYLLATMVTATVAYRSSRSIALAVVLSSLLVFNPSLWSGEARTFMREPLYFILALLTISMLTLSLQSQRFSRRAACFTVLAGVLFGGFWFTREESIWIYPPLAIIFFSLYFAKGTRATQLRRSAKHLLAFASGYSIVAVAMVLVTWTQYGTLTTNDFRGGAFLQAMGSLQRIDAPSTSPFVPVSTAALEHAEQASPTLAQIAPILKASPWAKFGSDLPGKQADEISGASFAWALRSAAASQGFHENAKTAERFYQAISQEIEQACELKSIPCNKLNTGIVPKLSLTQLPNFWAAFWESLAWSLSIRTAELNGPAWSTDHRKSIDTWRETLGPTEPLMPAFAEKSSMFISGWVASKSSRDPHISVPGSQSGVTLKRYEAPDVARHLSKNGLNFPNSWRYSLEAECVYKECQLKINQDTFYFNTLDKAPFPEISRDGFLLHIDKAFFQWTDKDAVGLLDPNAQKKLLLMDSARKIYAYLIPAMCFLAALGVVAYGFLVRRHPQYLTLWLFTLAAAAFVLIRAAMVGYIDSTSWRAVNVRNLLPAYGFSIIFATMGSYLLAKCFGFGTAAEDAENIRP